MRALIPSPERGPRRRPGVSTLRGLMAAGAAGALIGPVGGVHSAWAAPGPDGSLALMPLGAADLGGLADGLAVGPDSGAESAAQAAVQSSVPCQTPAGLRRGGWREGQSLSFGDPVGRALRHRSGVVAVDTVVQRYRDPSAAARAVRVELAADRATLGRPSPQGGTVLGWHASPVPDLGPEARLVEETIGLGTPGLWGTYLVARHDDLVTFVAVIRADSQPSRAALTQAARTLQARIDAVQRGEVKDPAPETPAAPAAHPARPRRGPHADRMTLRAADLGRRAYAVNGFYSIVSRGVAGYHAELSSACQATALDGVQVDLILTPNRASGALTLSANYRSLERSTTARMIVASGAGMITRAVVRARPLTVAGSRVKALEITTDGPLGTSEVVVAVVGVGRVVAIMTAGSRTGRSLPAGEAERLVRALTRRITTELNRRR